MIDHSERACRAVVIGGGISGLSSAFYMRRMAAERGLRMDVTIVEPASRLGGKIETLRRDGFVIEKGPDSFLTRKQPIIDLADDLGLSDQLVTINPSGRRASIVRDGKLYPMPDGLVLGIPTAIKPFMQTGLLKLPGKLRALLDFVMPAKPGDADESIGAFLERRLGHEAVEWIAEPLLAGIYAGELDKLSLRATFPQFREAEQRTGSLIRGTRQSAKRGTAVTAGSSRFKGAPFLTFQNGLSSMVVALERELADAAWKRGQRAVRLLTGGGDATADRYTVELDNGDRLPADIVIVTAPAYEAAQLLAPHVDTAMLQAIRYVSVANVVLAYDKSAFGREVQGSGFLVPRSEGRTITACTWTSTKWLHTSPPDKVLLRCYVGRSGDEEAVSLPDDQLRQLVQHDINELLGVRAEPLFAEITRLPRSMPQYPVGHVERSRAFRQQLAETLPGVYAVGAAFDGVGLPDCIRQARDTAASALTEQLGHN